MNPKRILFVCTGNSCRSVMAQELMKHTLARAGITTVQVESAGVFAIEGMGPTGETRRVLQDAGLDCAGHRARTLTSEMVERADLILVMERLHAEEVIRRLPSTRDKIHLLKAYGASTTSELSVNIPDPIGKPLEVYEVCFADIREAVERVARSLGVHSA